MRRLRLAGAVALASLSGLSACSEPTATEPRVEIGQAYIKPPLAGRNVASGYFEARAIGADAELVSASSPIAMRVELHTHTMDDGAMRMRRVRSVPLQEGETVRFEPAGYHLMMFGVDVGDATDANVTLTYADGTSVTLTVPIGAP